eukprot:jgi/Tetstr1/432515/TSEL_021889.t1
MSKNPESGHEGAFPEVAQHRRRNPSPRRGTEPPTSRAEADVGTQGLPEALLTSTQTPAEWASYWTGAFLTAAQRVATAAATEDLPAGADAEPPSSGAFARASGSLASAGASALRRTVSYTDKLSEPTVDILGSARSDGCDGCDDGGDVDGGDDVGGSAAGLGCDGLSTSSMSSETSDGLSSVIKLSAEAERSHVAASVTAPLAAVVSLTVPAAKSAKAGNPPTRPPARVTAVLDRSGSMGQQNKLELALAATRFVANQLDADDSLGIIIYAGESEASELFKLSKMTPMGKAYVGAALDRVELGGGTNLSAGLFHGIEQQKADLQSDYEAMVQRLLAGGPSPGSNTPIAEAGRVADSEPVPPMRAVLLLSDGQPTIGLRDTEALAAMMQEMLPDDGTPDQPTAVRVHTFGFGTDHDPHLLGKLAEVGRGNYYAIEEPHQVSQVLGEAMAAVLTTTCRNVTLTVVPGSNTSLLGVRSCYSSERLAHGGFAIQVGDLYAEERKDIVLDLQVEPLTVPEGWVEFSSAQEAHCLLHATASFIEQETGEVQSVCCSLTIKRPRVVDPIEVTASEEVQLQLARLDTAAAMQAAQACADKGQVAKGRFILADILRRNRLAQSASAGSAGSEWGAPLSQRGLDLLKALESDIEFTAEVFKDARTYHRRGQMRTFMMTTAHQRQRSTGSVAASTLAPRAGAAGSTGPGAAASRPHTSIYSTSSQRTAIYQAYVSSGTDVRQAAAVAGLLAPINPVTGSAAPPAAPPAGRKSEAVDPRAALTPPSAPPPASQPCATPEASMSTQLQRMAVIGERQGDTPRPAAPAVRPRYQPRAHLTPALTANLTASRREPLAAAGLLALSRSANVPADTALADADTAGDKPVSANTSRHQRENAR